jgi:DNA-binding protein YbaB
MFDPSSLFQMLGPIQESLKKAGSERASAIFEGKAGGGAVIVRLGGDLVVKEVVVAPGAGTDPLLLADLMVAASNDALRQCKNRFGATPEEQLTKALGGAGGMLGPLLGGLGKR